MSRKFASPSGASANSQVVLAGIHERDRRIMLELGPPGGVPSGHRSLHHAQAPAVLDHSRTLPQGDGACQAIVRRLRGRWRVQPDGLMPVNVTLTVDDLIVAIDKLVQEWRAMMRGRMDPMGEMNAAGVFSHASDRNIPALSPSSLISCSQPAPLGGRSAGEGRHGPMKLLLANFSNVSSRCLSAFS